MSGFIPLSVPNFGEKEAAYAAEAITSGWVSTKMCIRDRGNTAQFPPSGLSTASAAAARHLRCQNAR